MKKLFKASILSGSLVAVATMGAPPHDHTKCEHKLVDGTENVIVPSGRDDEVQGEYRKAVDDIFGPNGVARRLGLATPPHQIEFAPSGQLMALANLGRHPIGHWRDGSILATRAYGAAGVLEFVTPGCPTCRSYYSDTTELEEQISILFHVAGHNDFAAHSIYSIIRETDPILESLKLYDLMEDLYSHVDHDEVSQWYQYLESLVYDQDIARGSFDDPSTFDPENIPGVRGKSPTIVHTTGAQGVFENPYRVQKHIRRPSPSLLQAIVVNLPQTAPRWKRDMAIIFERINRVYGYYASIKIMNEGWATMMQEILAGHSPYASHHHDARYADLMVGVAGRASLSNPYYFGRECWRILRGKFEARDEIKHLAPFDRDREFIKYAHKIIQEKDDYAFIRMALDENWIHKHKLFLSRAAHHSEYDYSLPRSRDPNNTEQKVIVTRDAKRIIDYLAKKFGDKRFMAPRIFIEEFNAFGRSVVSMRHDVVDNIPLDRDSAAQRLYVQARLQEKPVSLFTVASTSWTEVEDDGWNWWWRRPKPPLKVFPIRIEVEPTGKVYAYDRLPKPEIRDGVEVTEVLNPALTAQYQDTVTDYQNDQSMAVNAPLDEYERQKFLPAVEATVQNAMYASKGMMSHSPTAARALLEYASLLEQRLVRRLEMALAGKIRTTQTKTGVRFRVLPEIPTFAFDHEVQEKLLEALPPVPPDRSFAQTLGSPYSMISSLLPALSASAPKVDDGLDPYAGDGEAGDKYWGRPKDGGGGEGGNEAGDEHKDPSEVEIPLDVYSQFLNEQIELPNLKPKDGESELTETLKDGGVHRPHGDKLLDRMTPMIIFHGRKALEEMGVAPEDMSQQDIFREGMRRIQPSDSIVRDTEEVPIPEMNAVVQINMDMSMSMHQWTEMAKDLIFNLRAALMHKYKHIEFIFIGFDTQAVVFPDAETFFKNFLGGGTDYSVGFKRGAAEFDRYPHGRWDRYFIGIGDSDDNANSALAIEALDEIYNKTEFSGYVHVGQGGRPDLLDPMRTMAQNLPYFRFVHLQDTSERGVDVLRKLFGKAPVQ